MKFDCEVDVNLCNGQNRNRQCTCARWATHLWRVIKRMGNGDRAFCITYYGSEDVFAALRQDAAKVKYFIYGRETCPTTGRTHLQTYIYFKEKKSFRQVRSMFPGIASDAVRVAGGSARQNALYCRKGSQSHAEFLELKEAGPNYGKDADYIEFGSRPLDKREKAAVGVAAKKERNKVLLEKSIVELVESGEISLHQVPCIKKAKLILAAEYRSIGTPHHRGVWVYGPPQVGKSSFVRTRCGIQFEDHHKAQELVYDKPLSKWWDGYNGQKFVLIDDFDTHGECLGHHMKRWLDKYPVDGEIKGGVCSTRYEYFYITSNFHPSEIFSGVILEVIMERLEIIHCPNKMY